MTEPEKCPECGGELEQRSFDVKGYKRTATVEFSFCPDCGWTNKQRIRHQRTKQ